MDLHLNGEDSVSRQVARLEAEQKRRRKETRAKHREEKAAAKLKASEEETTSEVEGESKMLRLLTTHFSLDWVDGSLNNLRYSMYKARVLGCHLVYTTFFVWPSVLEQRSVHWSSTNICGAPISFQTAFLHLENAV